MRFTIRLKLPSFLAVCAVTVIVPLVTASAQTTREPPNHCLVELKTPSETFTNLLNDSGWTPVAHSNSGRYWLLESSSSCNSALSLANVKRSHPAASLIVTLKDGVSVPEKQIEDLGGIVTGKLQNLNVITIAVPVTAVSRVARISGVVLVQKDQPQTTNGPS